MTSSMLETNNFSTKSDKITLPNANLSSIGSTDGQSAASSNNNPSNEAASKSRRNTAIGSIYNVSASSSTSQSPNRRKSNPSHSYLYTVSNFQAGPRPQTLDEPESTVTTINPTINDTVSSISQYLPSLQSKQMISDIVSKNNMESFDEKDDKHTVNTLNVITSALTDKLLSFDIDSNNSHHNDYNYANVRQQRLSLIHGYCDSETDYIFSTDLKSLIFAYCNSMLSWSISDEAMEQFRSAEHKQVMIGPQLGLEGATLALTIYPQGWSSRADGYVGIYLELINKDDPNDTIQYIQASVTIWVKELDLVYKTSMFLRRVGGAVGIDSQMLLFEDIKKLDQFTFEADIDVQGIKYKQETNIPPRILSNVPYIKDTEFLWNIDDDILQIMKYSQGKSVNYSDNFGDNCMLLEFKRARCKNKLCLKVLRMPLDVIHYITDITWTVFYDNQRVIIKNENLVTKVFKGNAIQDVPEFSINEMNNVNVLSFKIEIKVKKIEIY